MFRRKRKIRPVTHSTRTGRNLVEQFSRSFVEGEKWRADGLPPAQRKEITMQNRLMDVVEKTTLKTIDPQV